MHTPVKIRNRVTEKEAIQFDANNEEFFWQWLGDSYLRSTDHGDSEGVTTTITIRTQHGEADVLPGDWIIKGLNGEFYPCKPEIFEKSYEVFE